MNGTFMTEAYNADFDVAARYVETYSSTVFVGHAVSELDDIWQQISRRRVVRTRRNFAG